MDNVAGGMTTTGLSELVARVTAMPSTARQRFRARASRAAQAIKADAQARLRSQTHGTGATADAIVVTEEPEQNRFLVTSPAAAHAGRKTDQYLPNQLEYGTSKMDAKPYMGPARRAEAPRYQADQQAIADKLAQEIFG